MLNPIYSAHDASVENKTWSQHARIIMICLSKSKHDIDAVYRNHNTILIKHHVFVDIRGLEIARNGPVGDPTVLPVMDGDVANVMLTKRRFWTTEQSVAYAFLK